MKQVTTIETGSFGAEFFTTYNFKSGHVLRKYLKSGCVFAYTPSGNYASQPTMYKLIASARDHVNAQ